jgi:uncharacterized ubiquitin-like protein YukD
MDISVRYKTDSFAVKLTSTTVKGLSSAIQRQTGVPPREQKIIFKGKILGKKDALSDSGIGNGAKLLLLREDSSDQPQKPTRRNARERTQTEAPLISEPHAGIISRGPPAGCMEGVKTPVSVFPKNPFIVYDSSGSRASLSIESEAIWVQSESGEQERIFLSDLKTEKCQDLPGYGDRYVALSLGTDSISKIFYFVPKQFQGLFDEYCKPLQPGEATILLARDK